MADIPMPISRDGLVPFVLDGDFRILSGRYTEGAPFPSGYDQHAPNDAGLAVSNYAGIAEQSSSKLRFVRPIVDAHHYETCSPGSRVGFVTDAPEVAITLQNTALLYPGVSNNASGYILVDGVKQLPFSVPNAFSVATVIKFLQFGSSRSRKIEVVWPYGASFDLLGVAVTSGHALTAATYPTKKLYAHGDSMTQGFWATDIPRIWAFRAAELWGGQLVNLGNGGQLPNVANGGAVAGAGAADRITYCLGYNSFATQQPLATMQVAVLAELQATRTVAPLTKVIFISLPYGPAIGTIPLSSYRAAGIAAFTAWADANSAFVDGLTMFGNFADRLNADQIHPNDLGHLEWGTNIAPYLS